jgi:hypothetical protein
MTREREAIDSGEGSIDSLTLAGLQCIVLTILVIHKKINLKCWISVS